MAVLIRLGWKKLINEEGGCLLAHESSTGNAEKM